MKRPLQHALRLEDSEPDIETFDSRDDYETPGWLALRMARMILPTDRRILEPAAGTGQIAQHLPIDRHVDCFEIKPNRVDLGLHRAPACQWHRADWLETKHVGRTYDLIITNPPWSLGCRFLNLALSLLDSNNPEARVLLLLPGDYFQCQSRARELVRSRARISHRHEIVGRVGYLRDGQPVRGRQIYDAIYDLRPGPGPRAVSPVFGGRSAASEPTTSEEH